MKKYILTSAVVLGFAFTNGQTNATLDTIYANDQKNVALFFPHPIVQGITGSPNFVFTYNREKQQNLGLLQAVPGQESNLLVISSNGEVYSYILRFREDLSILNYFIPESQNIGSLRSFDTLKAVQHKKPRELKEGHYQELCLSLLHKKQRIGRIRDQNQGIVLSIENIVFHGAELYFVIRLENRSSLDYDINFLNLSIGTRQKGKQKSVQSLLQNPVFKYEFPNKVKQGQAIRFVYVYPKFSMSKDRRAIVELNEKNGERNINLKISHRFINNPN